MSKWVTVIGTVVKGNGMLLVQRIITQPLEEKTIHKCVVTLFAVYIENNMSLKL